MIRKIIQIDQELCNGCGLCAAACHEGAIGMEKGKAVLLRDDYCDGLGDCLPVCPTGAITFVEREAAAFDKAAVEARMGGSPAGGCPGSRARVLGRQEADSPPGDAVGRVASALRQWPVQIKLVPVNAPYFDGADLLVAADCTAFAYGDFHRDFLVGRRLLVGCPKLDEGDYAHKLTEIFRGNDMRSVTVLRMEVPCCGGMAHAALQAAAACGKELPVRVVTLSLDGEIVGEEER